VQLHAGFCSQVVAGGKRQYVVRVPHVTELGPALQLPLVVQLTGTPL
jgi:hypothetical protein